MNSEVELIAGVIRGGLPPPELPAPRLIKIFISCGYGDFENERQELLEFIGPELQSTYEDMGIEVLLIDVQYGTQEDVFAKEEYNECFLKEIAAAKRYSRGCFLIAFLSQETGSSAEEDETSKTIVERHVEHALALESDGNSIILLESPKIEGNPYKERVDERNIFKLEDNWKERMLERLQFLANSDIEAKPELKSRKRLVQEVYAESLCHLGILRKIEPINETAEEESLGVQQVLNKVRNLMEHGKSNSHLPILIQGGSNSLKSKLISTIYHNSGDYLSKDVHRIVRLINKTPRSSYSLELLRSLCQHLGFLTGNYDGSLPKEASFEPLYMNNWWNTILRHLEKNRPEEEIVILIDDIDRLRVLESDIVAALAWLPLALPPGTHLIITTNLPVSALKLTPVQKARLDCEEALLQLPARGRDDLLPMVKELSEAIGEKAATKLGCILSVTEFGLSESEILEILMPTDKEGALELEKGEFNFATWCFVKWRFAHMMQVRVMSGRLLISLAASGLKEFYLISRETAVSTHKEVSGIFFSDTAHSSGEAQSPETSHQGKERPFNTKRVAKCLTYNLRHVEEAWLHLLFAESTEKLKKYVVCAYDFLLAAVQMISISYLRCVLENVRRHYLERDVELVYFAIRKSSDVLTREPMQLAGQLISWLRSVAEDSGDMVSQLIIGAMAWCDGFTAPLLVPLNSWLQQPLPLQVRSVNVSGGVRAIYGTRMKQLMIVVPLEGDPQVRHVGSGQLLGTLKGHSAPVTCVATSGEPHLIFTGSEDTSIIIWDLKTLTIIRRVQQHNATVLCLSYSKRNNLLLSGGEDSRIIAYDLVAGAPKIHIGHHRGPITALATDTSEEVLVCSSTDRTISFFCLNSFTLLNTLTLPSPIVTLSISYNSVFLLVFCKDNKLYLRSLATGTEIHLLKGYTEKIRNLAIAYDSKRAICGTEDGKILVFDMNSGRLIRSLVGGGGSIESLYVMEKDDFLVCGGAGKVTFWPFRCEESLQKQRTPSKSTVINEHTSAINCLTISRDGTMVATGGVDSMVNLWQLNTCELVSSFEGHIASVTCVDFAVSGLFIASGSEDKTVRVWGLTLGLVVATFRHQAPLTAVNTLMDARRIVSSDRSGCIRVWAADTGVLLQSIRGPGSCLAVSGDMRHAVCGTGDNTLRISHLNSGGDGHPVSHTQEITCSVITPDSQLLITGSKDTSLKVWQLSGGKLSQVLVGHTDHVTCVAVSLGDLSKVISGSRDTNVIIWDINTGTDLHTLQGHTGCITCVRVSDDGTVCVSGSEDKSLMLWDTKKGTCLSSISLHVPVLGVEMVSDCSRLALFLLEHRCMPILCLHNTPAQYVKVPIIQSSKEIRVQGTKRPVRRLLKKEVSLDTYTWQRKYGHLTSGLPISEENLKRRFSVSASMEEISKSGLEAAEPKEAGVEQSKHFDQLEAIWNMQGPSNRRILHKQGSLRECRIEDSEEEELSN